MDPGRDAPPHMAVVLRLGDDLLREVFLHLPAAEDLICAAAACKPFLGAARCAPFLRRFRRLHPSTCPRLLGCLTLRTDRTSATPLLLTSASSSSAPTAHGGDFALSFVLGGGWRGGAALRILDCRNGRLLLENLGTRDLVLADPIAHRCIALPVAPIERVAWYGLVADDGDSTAFRVVCVWQDAASRELRALVLTSGDLSWTGVVGLACQHDLAGSWPMQANRSLYWRLLGGEGMVAFSTATMEFSLLELPPSLRDLSFDVIEKGGEEDVNVIHLLTMRGFCIEVWAGVRDGDCGMKWRRVEKSLRFHKVVVEMFKPSAEWYQHELEIVGVAAGVVFVRQWDNLFSIDLETMKLKMLWKKDCPSAPIYPYTIAWPPSFLNPAGQEM